MLVDDDERILGADNDPILRIIGGGKDTTKLATGIYEMHHFGGSHFPGEGYIEPFMSAWRIKDPEEREAYLQKHRLSINSYGVCDDYQQVIDQCPELQDPNRRFVICVTPIVRAEQSPTGGWRWHKWGPYIGKHEPQYEYLYDEKGIEKVFVYHIYEQDVPDEVALDVG